jgi:hypothetical protein
VGLALIASHEKRNALRKNHEGIAAESQVAGHRRVAMHTPEEAVVLALQAPLEVQQLHFDSHEGVAEHHSVLRDHLISAFSLTTGIPRP